MNKINIYDMIRKNSTLKLRIKADAEPVQFPPNPLTGKPKAHINSLYSRSVLVMTSFIILLITLNRFSTVFLAS